ncbi:PilZ domain-containing protein [Nitrospiraceae bacterium AH_259_D15_M11_P09]|nr:PilZ domain-containing protein [Nitrospiraceae bacterium AH_259_D15_M11_P09]
MRHADPLTLLLVNEHAEEIKQATISMRNSYPGCRVEAVYSVEEALEWASKKEWGVILLDGQLPLHGDVDMISELRHRAPHSVILVQAEHHDTETAAKAISAGADYYLFKRSPAFLTELPFLVREILEKRDLRTQLDLAQDRHTCLLETLPDIAFELDAEGRFVSIGPTVVSLLGATVEELVGTHYSSLLAPSDLPQFQCLLHERRTATRASRNLEVRLRGKDSRPVAVELSTTGLYSRQGKFLGTVGIFRSLPQEESQPVVEQAQRASALEELAPLAPAEQEPLVPYEEQRRNPRIDLRIRAYVSSNGSVAEAFALNISRSGMYLVGSSRLSVREDQPIQVLLKSEVGVLDIRGTIRGVREIASFQVGSESGPALGLAIDFQNLGAIERDVLVSILEELRAHPSALELTAFLAPQKPEGLGFTLDSVTAEKAQPTPSFTGPQEPSEISPIERRLAARVNLAIPASVQMDSGKPVSSSVEPRGLTANLSLGGTCIRLQTSDNVIGRSVWLRLPSLQSLTTGQVSSSANGSTFWLAGEVIWVTPDRTALAELTTASPVSTHRVGLRFFPPSDESRRSMAALVGRFLTTPYRLDERGETTTIVTEFLECQNEMGQRVAVSHDYPRNGLPPGSPLVIISPAYGGTKKQHVALAYYFASNGFHVLRYDHTNHVGESDGDMEHSTMSSMGDDIHAMLGFAERGWPASPIAVMATGLAGRIALKTATQDPRIKLLVLMACIVDLQATLKAAYQEDLIGRFKAGVRQEVLNVLGFPSDRDRFFEDAIKAGFTDLQATIDDANQVRTPVILLPAERDSWVPLDSVKQIQTALGSNLKHLWVLAEAPDRLFERPGEAQSVFRQLLVWSREELFPLLPTRDIQEPSQREIGLQRRLEEERARARHFMGRRQSVAFWRDYLNEVDHIVDSTDYWQVLDQIHRAFGTLNHGAQVLDAGCGNGHFAAFLRINQSYRERLAPKGTALGTCYVGVDFISTALSRAKLNLARVSNQLENQDASLAQVPSSMIASFCLVDLDLPLPFRANQFNKIVCNLVLASLYDPLFTLREFVRILSPEGTLVVTCLKPHADLLEIYRNFVQVNERSDRAGAGRQLLNNFAKISQNASDGTFRSFSRADLKILLNSSGAVHIRIHPTFADQAYIAVAEKPAL